MKNKLIDSVIAKMGETLSPQELFALRKALEFELECYEIFPTPDNENKAKKANDELAGQFISASVLRAALRKRLPTTKILFEHSLMKPQRNCMM